MGQNVIDRLISLWHDVAMLL